MKDVLLPVREIRQFMPGEGEGNLFLLPYAPAYLRLLQSLGAPEHMNYSFVMSVSGAATRLAWLPGWSGGEPQSNLYAEGGRLAELRRGFKGAGVEAEFCLNEAHKAWWEETVIGEVTWVNAEKARTDIVASLNKGVPVLASGLAHDAIGLIIGHEGNGARLNFISILLPEEEKMGESRYVLTSEKWADEIKMYCLVKNFTPRVVDRALLREVMQTVVTQARAENIGDCAIGLNAQQMLAEHLVWDEGFAQLDIARFDGMLKWPYERPEGYWREKQARSLGDRFWAGYCNFLCSQNGFDNLAQFLMAHNDVVPEWKEAIREAARCAERNAYFTGALWQHVSGNDEGMLKFQTDDIRSIFAGHMLRSKIYHLRMVEIFERLLKEE